MLGELVDTLREVITGLLGNANPEDIEILGLQEVEVDDFELHQLGDLISYLGENGSAFDFFEVSQDIDLEDLHDQLMKHGLHLDVLDRLLQLEHANPELSEIMSYFDGFSPETESTESDDKPDDIQFGKWSNCALCSCPGYQGTTSTSGMTCTRCGHHYDSHW
jgi:hypothetical protein